MLLSDVSLKPYIDIASQNKELKLLARYHFDKVNERQTENFYCPISHTLFPKPVKMAPTIHRAFDYALLKPAISTVLALQTSFSGCLPRLTGPGSL